MGGRAAGPGVRPAGLHPPLHGPADHRRHCQQKGVQVSWEPNVVVRRFRVIEEG